MSAQVQNNAATPSTPGKVRAWSIVAMLVVLMVINFADKIALGLAAKPIMAEFGLTVEQYGLAASSFFFLFFVAALLGGFAANRVRTTWLIAAIALLWAVAQFSMLAATGLTMIILSRMLLGASEGPTYPLINHAAYKWLRDEDRSVASSLLTAGGALGALVGAPLLIHLIVNHGWRSAFVVSGVASLVWCVVWLFVGREGPLTAQAAPAPTHGAAPATSTVEGLRTSYWRTFTTGTFLASALAGFAAYWSVAIGLTFGPLYLENVVGLSLTDVGNFIIGKELFTIAVVYVGFGFLVKSMLGRGVSSRRARGVLGGVCVLVSGLAVIGFVVLPGTPLKLALYVVAALAVVTFPISQTVCAEITPSEQRGGVLGAYAAVFSLSGVIAPMLTGRLAERLGPVAGLDAAFLVMGGLLVAGGIAAVLFVRPAHDARRLAEHAGRQQVPLAEPTLHTTPA
jgi:MFS family permease